MPGILSIGVSSALALEKAMTISSQNIANAQTPNYTRRVADFAVSTGYNGVVIADVRRLVDDAARQNLQQCTSGFSLNDSYLQLLKNFEPLLDNHGSTGVGKAIQDSLTGLNDLNGGVTLQNRTLFLGRLNNLVNRVQDANSNIDRQLININQSLEDSVSAINNILTNIASINSQIATSATTDTLDLQDQRDALVGQLAQYVNVSAKLDANGLMDINLANGSSLVLGTTHSRLTATSDPANPANLTVAIVSNPTNIYVGSLITGGSMAALLNFREDLAQAQRGLGRFAIAISGALNAQNKLGMDGNTNLGGNIFTDINSTNNVNNRVVSNTGNAGTGSLNVSISNYSQLTTSDYQLAVGAAGAYTLTRISDGTTMASGVIGGAFPQTISADGFKINLTAGGFANGDQFIISPTRYSAGNLAVTMTDPTQLAIAMPVYASANMQNTGTGTVAVTSITDTTNTAFTSAAHALTPPVTIKFLTSTTYQLINTTSSAVIEGPIVYNPATGANVFPTPGGKDYGYRISLSGAMSANDTFSINYNSNGTGDNGNGRAMAALYSQGLILGNSGSMYTFNQGYDATVSQFSVTTNKVAAEYDASKALKKQAQTWFQQLSGVSIEEESIDLVRYQQAYQAAAQILEMGKSVFDAILSMIRR